MGGGSWGVKAIKGNFSDASYSSQMVCGNRIEHVIEPIDLIAAREHGHVLRGAYLDAFARLENAVMDQIVELESDVTPSAPLSGKLKKLAESKGRFNDGKMFNVKLEAICRLNEARADIVHAVLTVMVRYDGKKSMDYRFGFQNACDSSKPLKIVTINDFKEMAQEAMQLAGWLKKQKATAPAAPASASA